jgi:N-[(2S)-2-amino-2-carboxyethyl]-L-glutamate dehydrogenase
MTTLTQSHANQGVILMGAEERGLHTDEAAAPFVPMNFPVLRLLNHELVRETIESNLAEVRRVVREAYLRYATGLSTNPPSHFLRFDDRPQDRIIALLARDRNGAADTAGIKWISSFPKNIEKGLPRASAVIILNDMETGFPAACLEASAISAARTAASAALAARALHPVKTGQVLGVVGCGPIARAVHRHLRADGWSFRSVVAFDILADRATDFCAGLDLEDDAKVVSSIAEVANASDLLVFATTASRPHFLDADIIQPRHTILHLSLRDLGSEILRRTQNIVDDREHAVREGTSLGLAVDERGDDELISGTLAQILNGDLTMDTSRPRAFSPFGLGVLDLAVADYVHGSAVRDGKGLQVRDFFAGLG